MKTFKNGFTLVELAIAMIVIGLIVGGVTAGSTIAQQARIRTIINEATTYKSAISTFQTAYGALPGDISNASSYWPSCDGTPTNCNGNNNGWIDLTSSLTQNEALRAWQQLAASGIIPGSYTGIATVASQADIGTNVPGSKYFNAGYAIALYNYTSPGNVINFGAATTGAPLTTAVLTPKDAYALDLKIDDGLARNGNVWAYGSAGAATCYNTVSSVNQYNLSLTTTVCSLMFIFKSI
jgi:prepilin-type N-terminal cleavage/methylation domain-containing protein